MEEKIIITVYQNDISRSLSALPGQTVLDAICYHDGISLHAPCGGHGTCKKCTVYRMTPAGPRPCLACQTPVENGMQIRLPDTDSLHVQLDSVLTSQLSPDTALTGYGIACDIGTTTVVCQLVDLATGTAVSTLGMENSQRAFGADVISRIKTSMDGQLPVLTDAIRRQLSQMIQALANEADIPLSQISRMAVAANTTMCHILAGLSPDSIGVAPYIPQSIFGQWLDAQALEMPFSGQVYIAPAVSGYVGGDITADILAAGLDQSSIPTLLIDVGTNGEMALGCGEEFLCCSTAAGPAFEGAEIRFGMTAAPGAISSVEWKNGEVVCGILGDTAPKGICGSGLIDAVAMLLEIGALEDTGRLLDVEEDDIPKHLTPYLFLLDEEPAFRLAGEIAVTQADIRKLQLGKGAIAAGVSILKQLYGDREIGQLLLAGGFGSYIRPESAAKIGLIPEDLLSKTRAIGNSALLGAKMALVSENAGDRLAAIQENMRYQELSGMEAFNQAYIEMMMFPEVE